MKMQLDRMLTRQTEGGTSGRRYEMETSDRMSCSLEVRLDGFGPASDLGLDDGATEIKGGRNNNDKADDDLQLHHSPVGGIVLPLGGSDILFVLIEPFVVVFQNLSVNELSVCHFPNVGMETFQGAILFFTVGKKLIYRCLVTRVDGTSGGGSGGVVGPGSGRAALQLLGGRRGR